MSSAEVDSNTTSDSKSGSTAAATTTTTQKNPSRTPTSWDAEDDILLMHLKDNQKLGWKEIASHFNNRTPNACQFRWRRLKSGNLKNPPKSAAALGAQFKQNPNMNAATKKRKPHQHQHHHPHHHRRLRIKKIKIPIVILMIQ